MWTSGLRSHGQPAPLLHPHPCPGLSDGEALPWAVTRCASGVRSPSGQWGKGAVRLRPPPLGPGGEGRRRLAAGRRYDGCAALAGGACTRRIASVNSPSFWGTGWHGVPSSGHWALAGTQPHVTLWRGPGQDRTAWGGGEPPRGNVREERGPPSCGAWGATSSSASLAFSGAPVLAAAGGSRSTFLWHSPPGTSPDPFPAQDQAWGRWGPLTQEHLLRASLRICSLTGLCAPGSPCSLQRGHTGGTGSGFVCVVAAAQVAWLWLLSFWGPISRVFGSPGTSRASALPECPLGLERSGQCGVCALTSRSRCFLGHRVLSGRHVGGAADPRRRPAEVGRGGRCPGSATYSPGLSGELGRWSSPAEEAA